MKGHFSASWCRYIAARATVALPVMTLAVAVLATGCGTASTSHATGAQVAGVPSRGTGSPGVGGQQHTAAGAGAASGAASGTAGGGTAGTGTAGTGTAGGGAARATGAPSVAGTTPALGRTGPVREIRSSAAQIARLPLATTYGTTTAAPRDPAPFGSETGIVLHPTATRVIYARPGGPAVAALPVTQLGSPTWVPVVQSQPGWDRVLLPTRPDRSTGWIYLGGGGLQTAYSPYQVDINLARYRLTIMDAGRSLGTWTVAKGAASTPTPAGRTFVLASLVPLQPTYSPLILPLGTHSDTLTTYGGGPGTVGLHGWPDRSVFGHAVSHGCVRVPAAALRVLSRVPLGSEVMITG
jgi:lipoprotein-anchoring transpeptidase ErfK/SrfK